MTYIVTDSVVGAGARAGARLGVAAGDGAGAAAAAGDGTGAGAVAGAGAGEEVKDGSKTKIVITKEFQYQTWKFHF